MRIASSVTSISWIPSEAVGGLTKLPFEAGIAHYDEPPPDEVEDLEALRAADRFRFANELRAWIEVEGGEITGWGQEGGGMIGSTTLRVARKPIRFEAVPFADLRPEPEVRSDSVRFVQTAGGRTGVPAPRRVDRPPYVQFAAPTAWTTLALTIRADGTARHEVLGASPFPRHWVYDDAGRLAAKTGLVDFEHWYRTAFGKATPWGDADSPALVTQVESALERRLSTMLMKGGTPRVRRYAPGEALLEEGAVGNEVLLVLDGVVEVDVGGERLAELGPGVVLGERATLEEGRRTATVRAVTATKVAAADGSALDPALLAELAEEHRREQS